MKQRLGIAHALLGDPSVLILDEPANGLDPAGIRWMRGLLKGYADRGGTVLLSSHLLNEVELIADEMILIGLGRIVAQGNKDQLLANADHKVTNVTSLDNAGLAQALEAKGFTATAAGTGLRVDAAPVDVGTVAARAVHRPDRPALRRRWPRGPVPRAHQREPARRTPGRSHRMSTTAPNALSPGDLDLSSTSQVSMATLARVELRKALDTRAGRWLVIGILSLVVVVVVIWSFAAPDDNKDLQDYVQIPGGILGYFLPIIIIMLVTSEQSQRNGLVTFTLEPRRSRIVLAKFLAGLALAAAVMVLAFVLALGGTLLGAATGASPTWSVDGNLIFNGFILSNLIGVFIGFAISMLIMNTAGAIVAYFVYSLILPIAVGILGSLVQSVEDFAPWVEFNTAQLPLFEGDFTPSAEEWAQIATSGTIWLIVPLALGIWRLLRIEFK